MQASNKTLLNSLVIVSLTWSLAACNLPTPKDKDVSVKGYNTNASFTLQAMPEKSKALETRVQGNFELPSSKVYNFVACAKDVAYDKNIAGHDFMVEETNQKVTSDKAGCITWAEQINYNFLGDSQYVRIERHIKGLGLHKGSQRVAFAINPWGHGESSTPVLNPDDGNDIPRLINDDSQVGMALKGFSAEQGLRERPLWVEDGRMFVTEQRLDKNGVVLSVEMRPNASIQLTKMNGELIQRPVTAGAFKARIKMIHIYQHNNTEIRRLIAESEMFDVKMGNGSLAVKAPIELPAIPTRGQMMLGLELNPVGGPPGLKNFEGIYFLGEYDQLKGASFLKINTAVTQDKNFKISNYITASLMDVKHGKSGVVDDDAYQKPKIEVAQLEFRFIRVGKEQTSTREVFYNIRACVRHGLDQKNTRAHTFTVTKFKQNSNEPSRVLDVKTDNNSCINWDESITFNVFDCQHYLKGSVTIENQDLGMKEKLDIIVNPWESNGGAVARDVRYVDPTEKMVLDCKKEDRPRTQIMADNFNYNTLSYSYGVDSLLNLTVTKKILFKMDPRLLIYSSLSNGRAEVQRFRDGIYLLRLAVVKNRDYDSNQNTYVTSTDKLVNVLNGQISTEISFQTQDLKSLGNRNNLLIEIYPIDESKVVTAGNEVQIKDQSQDLSSVIDRNTSLESPTFVGPITLNIDEASRALRVLDASAVSALLLTGKGHNDTNTKDIINKVVIEGKQAHAKKAQGLANRADRNVFLKENNLDLIDLKSADAQAPLVKALIGKSDLDKKLIVTKADLQNLVQTGTFSPAIAQKLCAFWGSDYFKKMYASKGGVTDNMLVNGFGLNCYHAVAKDPAKFFNFEKHTLVKEVAGSRFTRGLNHGLTVGTNFSLSTSHSNYTNRSTSFNAKIGMSKKFLDLFSLGMDMGYTMSWGTSDGTQSSNSISVNGSTSMTVQHNTFQIRVAKYEQCAVVRLNPALFIKDTKSWLGRKDYLHLLNPRLSDEEVVNATTRGLMICEGEVRNQPKDITEDYYLIAQESNSSQMQDLGDERNRNFFIALRSKNDFERFVLAMRGQIKMPNSAQTEDHSQGDATTMLEKLFKLSGPAYPGVLLNK